MSFSFDRSPQNDPTPEMPSAVFDGTQLRLEAAMVSAWFSALPLATAIVGYQHGRKLGDQLAALTTQWFW
jgi:hypothetical protein